MQAHDSHLGPQNPQERGKLFWGQEELSESVQFSLLSVTGLESTRELRLEDYGREWGMSALGKMIELVMTAITDVRMLLILNLYS